MLGKLKKNSNQLKGGFEARRSVTIHRAVTTIARSKSVQTRGQIRMVELSLSSDLRPQNSLSPQRHAEGVQWVQLNLNAYQYLTNFPIPKKPQPLNLLIGLMPIDLTRGLHTAIKSASENIVKVQWGRWMPWSLLYHFHWHGGTNPSLLPGIWEPLNLARCACVCLGSSSIVEVLVSHYPRLGVSFRYQACR